VNIPLFEFWQTEPNFQSRSFVAFRFSTLRHVDELSVAQSCTVKYSEYDFMHRTRAHLVELERGCRPISPVFRESVKFWGQLKFSKNQNLIRKKIVMAQSESLPAKVISILGEGSRLIGVTSSHLVSSHRDDAKVPAYPQRSSGRVHKSKVWIEAVVSCHSHTWGGLLPSAVSIMGRLMPSAKF
jgi:hypothetical protein